MSSTEQALKVLKLFLTEMKTWEDYWRDLQLENLEIDYSKEQKKKLMPFMKNM